MERKLFGTDGIRGVANSHPVTADLAMKVGMAAGSYFTRKESHRHSVVIAKDTRLSGYMIEPALTSGFISVGMDVFLVGPMPTPAVSMLVRSLRADMGVMISASHNPFQDNGIKLFGPDGCKLSDEVELEIEKIIGSSGGIKLASADMLGRAKRLDDAPGRYIEYVKNTFPKGVRLDGLRIVVDCANGAAYHIAPKVFWELGAEVVEIGVDPNGFNINLECGSTHPDALIAEVKKHKAHLGIALDGDADRVVMCDENGSLIDGDQLIGLIAGYWRKTGQIKGGGVVTTVMSNLGLEKYLKDIGLEMIRAKVGDRYVLEEMTKRGINVGGEQSGHIILSDYSSTGDGIVTALQVLAVLREKQKPFSEIAKVFEPFPQILKSIRYGKGAPLEQENVVEAIKSAEQRLNGKGRLVVRKSGTEPLIRVMGEGENQSDVEAAVNHVLDTIKEVI